MQTKTKILLFVAAFCLWASTTQAQTTTQEAPAQPTQSTAPAGTVDCFDYYQFGSVQVDIQSRLSQTVPGTPMAFSGNLINQNNYPVVDGSVFVKIFRKDPTSDIQSNGYALVDQFVAKENISLPSNGKAPIKFDWKVPANAVGGEYQIATFFISGKKFNLLGLSFTDDVVGNRFDFKVTSANKETVSLEKSSVMTNDKQFLFAAFPPRFKAEETVTVKTDLNNTTKKEQSIPVTWTLYAWDGQSKENIIETKTETITVAANSKKNISYQIKPQTHPVSYLVIEAKNQDAKSILNVRVVHQGNDKIRLNFPALTSYPLKANQSATMFSCLHNSGQSASVAGSKLELTLKDEDGDIIDQNTYEGAVTGAMMAVKKDFTPKKDYANFTLSAKLYQNGKLVDSSDMKYDCKAIDPTLCPAEKSILPIAQAQEKGKSYTGIILIVVGIVLLLVGLITLILRKKREIPMALLVGLIMAAGVMFGGTRGVRAYSVSWSSIKESARIVSLVKYNGVIKLGGTDGINNLTTSVNYASNASVGGIGILNGSDVTVGSHFELQVKKFKNTDVAWFGTGYGYDSPYGYWVKDAKMPSGIKCEPNDWGYGTDDGGWFDVYFPLSVNLPVVTVDPVNATCSEVSLDATEATTLQTKFDCVASGPGPVSATVKFGATYGKFHTQLKQDGVCSNSGGYSDSNALIDGSNLTKINIPEKTINFNFNAVPAANQVPSDPTINNLPTEGTSTGIVNTNYNFDLKATDPDGDQIAYDLDLDMNGSVDYILPAAGTVASGTVQTYVKQWPVVGTQNFQVRARDSKGGVSNWVTHEVTISNCPLSYSETICVDTPAALFDCGANPGATYDTTISQCWGKNSCTLVNEPAPASNCVPACTNSTAVCPAGPSASVQLKNYREINP